MDRRGVLALRPAVATDAASAPAQRPAHRRVHGGGGVCVRRPDVELRRPAVFKAYIDQIVRVGRTFLYVPDDATTPYRPLVHGKRMFVVVSSGAAGYAPTGPLWPLNHLEPHLRTIFGFIGVSDMTFIYTGNDMAGGEQLERSLNEALAQICTIVHTST